MSGGSPSARRTQAFRIGDVDIGQMLCVRPRLHLERCVAAQRIELPLVYSGRWFTEQRVKLSLVYLEKYCSPVPSHCPRSQADM
eukprot:7326520-Lingulodinium_polyedra.AAC.1